MNYLKSPRFIRTILLALQICLYPIALGAQSLQPDPQAAVHRAHAKEFQANSDFVAAVIEYQQAYVLDKATNVKAAGLDLYKIGDCYYRCGQFDKALIFYQMALPIEQKDEIKVGEIATLMGIGGVYDKLGQYAEALDYYQQALLIQRHIGNTMLEGVMLLGIGDVYDSLNQPVKALEYYQEALPIQRKSGDEASQVVTLDDIGATYNALSRYSEALNYYQQAWALQIKIGDKSGEALTLIGMGLAYQELTQYAKALDYYQQALLIQRHIGNTMLEARTLSNIGCVYQKLSRYSIALNYYQQALYIERQVENKYDEAAMLNNIGSLYRDLGQYVRALDYYQAGLSLWRQLGKKLGEARTLGNIGRSYDNLSQYAKALDYFQRALLIQRQIGDKASEATTLGNIGGVNRELSQYNKALDLLEQSLLIDKQIGNTSGQAATLGNIGAVYGDLSQHSKALEFYQQALLLWKQIGDKSGEALTLGNIGRSYDNLSQHTKALDYFQQALLIQRQIGDKANEASTLGNIGGVYFNLSQFTRAVDFDQQALLIEQQIGDKADEAKMLSNMMFPWESLDKPGIAIFYGKQSINAYQSIRRSINGLDQESQSNYLAGIASAYRAVADLLIRQGRLVEAQQVLRLLKEREFFDFLNPDLNTPLPKMDRVVLTKHEAYWAAAYNRAANPLTVLGTQEQSLHLKKNRTPAEDAQHVKLQAQIANAAVVLQHVQKQITTAFSGPQSADDRLPRTTGAQELQYALPPGTVALYTIVAPDRLNLILITPRGQKAYTSAITADALYQNVLALRRALINPDVDPTGPAAVLYHLVLEPVQKDLDAAGAKTILFSLDDALRYVPPAALYNPQTKQYIAERYRTELITLAGARPATTPASNLRILGLGVSTSQDGAPALPGVAMELTAIVHEPGDAGGLVPGRRLMDGDFTQLALEERLKTAGYPLVHLASHFALHATQDTSYLLLGDGSHLTVADFAKDPHRFRGVELLTLSACQTAMEVRGSAGREVEGVGALAQTLGAGSVLASLWPVSDAATPPLMTALYGYRQQHPTASLAEALQAAQLYLLHKPMPASADTVHRGTEAVLSSGDSGNLPSFGFDPKAPYAHPFYWAPFILIGNWR